MTMQGLTRSTSDKMVAGVLGGFGARYGIDPTMLRLIYGAAAVFSLFVPLTIIYLAAVVLIPKDY